jgi:Putative auto-transporter adhesin, head GIN domain
MAPIVKFATNPKNMHRLIVLLAILAFSFQSCYNLGGKRVRGNGNIQTDERSVSAFDVVEVHGAMDVYVSQGELKPVRLEGDENLLKYIDVRQTGNRLKIGTRSGYNLKPTGKIKIYLSSPSYAKLDVSGACNIYTENKISVSQPLELEVSGAGDIKADVDAPKVTASISGSGSVNMKGQTRDFHLVLSGAGKANCFDLMSENTKVDISGAGSAEVFASVHLDAEVSGAGNVRYKGNAARVNQQVSGAGSVKKAE